jgi:hypothetical protein
MMYWLIKKECGETVNQAPVINFPVFNTDSSQQSLVRFIVENNLITLVPQQVHAFIVNDQKGKYCVTLFPKDHFSAFPKNHVGFVNILFLYSCNSISDFFHLRFY